MKLFLFLMILLGLRGGNLYSQLSGTVTINSTLPASSTNYQTFTALANTLNIAGVSGPLVVVVVPNTGPYIEQPVFNQPPGISALNSVIIHGNNNLLTYNANIGTQPWILLLNGADYFSFDHLNVSGTNTVYAMCCVLTNAATNNTFTACTFSCPGNGTSSKQIPVSISQSSTGASGSATMASGSQNVFTNCTMYNGYYGVSLNGPTTQPYSHKNIFVNCYITDWTTSGLYATYQQSLTIRYSSFDRPTRTTFSTSHMAIKLSDNPGGLIFEGNCITNLFGAAPSNTASLYVLNLYDSYPGLTAALLKDNVVNNLGGSGTTYGLYINSFYGSCNNNTVIINNNTNSSSFTGYGIYLYPSNSDSARFQNNFISMSQGTLTTQYGFYVPSIGKLLIDKNKYYIQPGPTSYIGYYNGNASTFGAWQGKGVDLQGMQYQSNPNFTISVPCGISTQTTSTLTVVVPDNKRDTEEMRIFPNPATDELTFEFPETPNHTITLKDITGREILDIATKDASLKLDIKNIPPGFFFLEIKNENGTVVKKILKE